ncbi:hypothetical protein SeMB42_g05647 [Synchytrium endobioticum]|uniref:Homeobox domain-containing protein n=1 Tax=Synchytrium endobioticum TaxID=286115 RepID=A0A507CQ41_9FUNG|nr:hypothetical protein SeMB42_g05647 [Synchytrium endobioticum]
MAAKRSYQADLVQHGREASSVVAGISHDGAPRQTGLSDMSAEAGATRKKIKIDAKDTQTLLEEFRKQPRPTTDERNALADKMGLPRQVVLIWFQNRRAKIKREARAQARGQVEDAANYDSYTSGNRARPPPPCPQVWAPIPSGPCRLPLRQVVAPPTAMPSFPVRPIYLSNLDVTSWHAAALAPNLPAGLHAQPVPRTVPPRSCLMSLNEWNYVQNPPIAQVPSSTTCYGVTHVSPAMPPTKSSVPPTVPCGSYTASANGWSFGHAHVLPMGGITPPMLAAESPESQGPSPNKGSSVMAKRGGPLHLSVDTGMAKSPLLRAETGEHLQTLLRAPVLVSPTLLMAEQAGEVDTGDSPVSASLYSTSGPFLDERWILDRRTCMSPPRSPADVLRKGSSAGGLVGASAVAVGTIQGDTGKQDSDMVDIGPRI